MAKDILNLDSIFKKYGIEIDSHVRVHGALGFFMLEYRKNDSTSVSKKTYLMRDATENKLVTYSPSKLTKARKKAIVKDLYHSGVAICSLSLILGLSYDDAKHYVHLVKLDMNEFVHYPEKDSFVKVEGDNIITVNFDYEDEQHVNITFSIYDKTKKAFTEYVEKMFAHQMEAEDITLFLYKYGVKATSARIMLKEYIDKYYERETNLNNR